MCPIAPEHGHMFVLPTKQYCAHIAHAGLGKERPPTRCFWPTGWKSFEAAVSVYTSTTAADGGTATGLPELDFVIDTLEV